MENKILVTRSSMPELDEYMNEITSMWDSHWLTNMGPKHKELQANLCDYLGVENIDLLTNGHMALELTLQAMNLQGEVITTPFTFASTTHAIVRNGLTPVFCDIDPDTYCMDASKIEKLITDRTCAIMPVHVYGNVYVMSKNFAVDMIENYHQMYGLKRFIFRLPTIYLYSPVDTFYVDGVERKIGYRLLIDKAIAGEPIEVWGDSSRVKDMVYVKDFCQMLYKALFVNRNCGYYNVGTGVGTSLLDQIKGMIDVFGENGKKSDIIMRPDKPNAPQYIMDITPAVQELGYHPQYNYLEMLQDFKKEMQHHKINGGTDIM